MTSLKSIYKARSVNELETLCDVSYVDISIKNLENTVSVAFDQADELYKNDEELGYICLVKALKVYDKYRSISHDSFSDKFKMRCHRAEELVIRLRSSLSERYKYKDQCELLLKLPVCSDAIEHLPKRIKSEDENETNHFPGRWMPPSALYERICKNECLFFVDVREKASFTERKIKQANQINFGDPSSLSRGITITLLMKRLSDIERDHWSCLQQAHLIILLDETSGEELIERPQDAGQYSLTSSHPLKIIYDALVTYNAEKHLLPPTVFLAGGIEEFCKRYPSIISLDPLSVKKAAPSTHARYDKIGYPCMDEDIEMENKTEVSEKPVDKKTPSTSIRPRSHRNLSYNELANKLNQLNAHDIAKQLCETNNTPITSNTPDETISVSQSSIENLRKLKPNTEEADQIMSYRKSIDRTVKPRTEIPARSTLSYETISSDVQHQLPSIDRSKKPLPNQPVFGDGEGLSPSASVQLNIPKPPSSTNNDVSTVFGQMVPYRITPLRRGLTNLGNTCYMNSILQALLHTSPDLHRFFMAYTRDRQRQSQVALVFAQLVHELSSNSSTDAVKPHLFKAAIGSLHHMFSGSEQQDSHEFLMILLDCLHEDMNKASRKPMPPIADSDELVDPNRLALISWERNRAWDNSEILDWFNGQLRSTVQCKTCNHRSYTFDELMYLSLSVQGSGSRNLKSCVKSFFQPEDLSGNSRWMCPHCKKPREAVKTFDIWRLPIYLIIHLKRFQCAGACQKIESNITYPLTDLSLSSFAPQINSSLCNYDLYAVSNHYGSMNSGHYTAFCLDAADQQWYKFDDNHVSLLSKDKVQTQAAYILFYKRSVS